MIDQLLFLQVEFQGQVQEIDNNKDLDIHNQQFFTDKLFKLKAILTKLPIRSCGRCQRAATISCSRSSALSSQPGLSRIWCRIRTRIRKFRKRMSPPLKMPSSDVLLVEKGDHLISRRRSCRCF